MPQWYQWHHMTKKSFLCTFFDSLALTNTIMTLTMPSALYEAKANTKWNHMTKNVMLHLTKILMTKQIQWWYWWCHWNHMMLMLVPVASLNQNVEAYMCQSSWAKECNGAIYNAICITWVEKPCWTSCNGCQGH